MMKVMRRILVAVFFLAHQTAAPLPDATRVGIEGVSRYGKAALVTMAFESRFALVLVGKVPSAHTRRQRVKDAAADSALVAENIVEWAPAVSTMHRVRACLRQIA